MLPVPRPQAAEVVKSLKAAALPGRFSDNPHAYVKDLNHVRCA